MDCCGAIDSTAKWNAIWPLKYTMVSPIQAIKHARPMFLNCRATVPYWALSLKKKRIYWATV
jgi:hypothetical protein